jgi:protein-S-isoprenylcysteine O-methyltransferase Ste14
MDLFARVLLAFCWAAWLYPFLFRAPHNQKRASITRKGATTAGLLLETTAIGIAWFAGWIPHDPTEWWRIAAILILSAPSIALAWSAVKHLGKQFRVNAGLYEDHELVRTGAYSMVRHPIYAGLFGMTLATVVLAASWPLALLSVILFIAGTEIRVHTEDGLLASRFPGEFAEYQKQVSAYVPFVR